MILLLCLQLRLLCMKMHGKCIGDESVKSCSHVDEVNKERDGCVRSPMSWLRTSSNNHNVNNDGLVSTYICGIQKVSVTLVSTYIWRINLETKVTGTF